MKRMNKDILSLTQKKLVKPQCTNLKHPIPPKQFFGFLGLLSSHVRAFIKCTDDLLVIQIMSDVIHLSLKVTVLHIYDNLVHGYNRMVLYSTKLKLLNIDCAQQLIE